MGTKPLIRKKSLVRDTWDLLAVKGWYLGLSM